MASATAIATSVGKFAFLDKVSMVTAFISILARLLFVEYGWSSAGTTRGNRANSLKYQRVTRFTNSTDFSSTGARLRAAQAKAATVSAWLRSVSMLTSTGTP